MRWWLSSGNKPKGPFPTEHVAGWLKSGQLAPDVMACPEGGQEWKRLDELDVFVGHVPRPPAAACEPPPPPAGALRSGTAAGGDKRHRAKFGILTAAIVLSGCCLLLDFLFLGDVGDSPCAVYVGALGVWVASLITWALFHYHLWRLLPAEFAEVTPGQAVGYLFIPFYNCYWVFRSYLGINRGLNRLADAHSVPPPRANTTLATAASVFFVVAWFFFLVSLSLPTVDAIGDQYLIRDRYDLANAYDDVVAQHVGFNLLNLLVSSIPSVVLWLLMVLNQKKMVEHLLEHNVPVNPTSGLLYR